MTKIVIADIDGCCLELDPNWAAPFVGEGTPIPQGVHIYRQFLDDLQFKVLFITARPERKRNGTLRQLREHVAPTIEDEDILMRPPYMDDVPAEYLKSYLLFKAGYDITDVFIAFDDNPKVVAAWRALGIICYQTGVENGNQTR